ncbi:unnamed protein product [Ceutorhynchus assimilis]|uniref:Bestrophin homolog n=1 Tax=Ceutorhynchus assimilis TaxID=467358 RepID=A0A9N9MQM2_9CUCU|nr:unnamed protein product [Ceutorhynchus assimilis]
MTVTYSSKVTSSTGIGIFLKLLARWRGSIYKIVWVDLILYLTIYYALNLLYLYGLDEKHGRKYFINMVTYFSHYGSAIPLSFVLGFFVNIVYNRWWSQYQCIPYPDGIAILVGAGAHGNDDKSRMIRRTIMRYVCAGFTLTLTMISPKVKKRFPTLHHFVEAGLLTCEEKNFMQEMDKDYPTYASKYWLPLAWAANVATTAREENIIKDDMALKDILEHINDFREKCKKLWDYDWICIPLVYTQVVTFAVYLYFIFNVLGTQFVDEIKEHDINILRFPLMSCVEFFFYMGWLKVAESLINPFGEDDDDFEVVWLIDRHLQVSYILVDKIHNSHPTLTKDKHWKEIVPHQLPFTIASRRYMNEHPVESTCDVCVQRLDQDLIVRDDDDPEDSEWMVSNPSSNPISKLFSRKKLDPGYHLKKVVFDTEDNNDKKTILVDPDEKLNLLNSLKFIDEENNKEQSSASGDNKRKTLETDETVMKESIERRKEDLLNLLDALKDDREKAKKLLDEIIK